MKKFHLSNKAISFLSSASLILASAFVFGALSISSYSSEVNTNGYVDVVSRVEVNHESYIVNNTIVMNKDIVDKDTVNQIQNSYAKDGTFVSVDDTDEYYVLRTTKELPEDTYYSATEIGILDNVKTSVIDGVVTTNGRINIDYLKLPQDLVTKYYDRFNIELKIKPATAIVDSTGISTGSTITYLYKPNQVNYIEVSFKKPQMIKIPFLQITKISQLLLVILVAVLVGSSIMVLIKKVNIMYASYKENKAYQMDDVSYFVANNRTENGDTECQVAAFRYRTISESFYKD